MDKDDDDPSYRRNIESRNKKKKKKKKWIEADEIGVNSKGREREKEERIQREFQSSDREL